VALHFLLDAASGAGPGAAVTLTGAEAHHAAAVRRVRVGEEITVGDGAGAWLTGTCESVAPREVVVRITARDDVPPAVPRLVLVQALAKGDRDELAVQAAAELGADEIVPWQASRSVSRWDAAKTEKGRTRWAGIVREAAKQAHRAWVPDVAPVVTTTQLAARTGSADVLVLEPTADERLSIVPLSADRDIVLIVGPEGGIAPGELEVLATAGARLVRLGTTVLRTSTAGPAALAVMATRLGRW